MIKFDLTKEESGFSVLEIIITMSICVVVIMLATQFFNKGQRIENIFSTHETAEQGWQRFIQRLREDARSATEIKTDVNRLLITVNSLDADGVLNSETAEYFLDEPAGYLVIKSSTGDKNIEFATGKNQKGQVTFRAISTGNIEVSATIDDTRTKGRIFSREEILDAGSHE